MLSNEEFLEVIRKSFEMYLSIDTSRSPKKLKILHGSIAKDLQEIYGKEYQVQSQGYGDDEEASIDGRYYPKKVDITISKNGKPIAGYAVKFVMRNYSQNSNNYFENMLGETANIRSNSIPYFQIFIVFEKVPYYKKGGEFERYDVISENNLKKYFVLSADNPDKYYHTPDKTLIILINLKEEDHDNFMSSEDYANYYLSIINDDDLLFYSNEVEDIFDESVILNDYSDFIKRSFYIVLGKMKNIFYPSYASETQKTYAVADEKKDFKNK